jgi:hypothetical protein
VATRRKRDKRNKKRKIEVIGFEMMKEGEEMRPFTIWAQILLFVVTDSQSVATDWRYKR